MATIFLSSVKSAPCVRRDDSWFVMFCLYLAEFLGKPRFGMFDSITIVVVLLAIFFGLTVALDSLLPFEVLFGVLGVMIVPAFIGAIIRNKRIALFEKD